MSFNEEIILENNNEKVLVFFLLRFRFTRKIYVLLEIRIFLKFADFSRKTKYNIRISVILKQAVAARDLKIFPFIRF